MDWGSRARAATVSPTTPGRDETEEERDDRNLMELLQELRVGALGVQVLFGFLLSLPFFAVRFGRLSGGQRGFTSPTYSSPPSRRPSSPARSPTTASCSDAIARAGSSGSRTRWR
jgi:type III secretory pathway component EscT